MSEDRTSNGHTRGWLGRLSQALSGEPKDRGELIELMRDAERRQLLDQDALAMIEGALQVSEMQARDIVIPRSQMSVIEEDETLPEILNTVVESGHSRFPVIGDNRDEVVGILLAKDLLAFSIEGAERFNVRDLLRPVIFIPESKRLDVLLREFRANRNHLAIVVDEYGGVAGMVTIEDVLEQIVGEIEDEYDVEEDNFILKHSEANYTLKALTPIEDFNEYFGADFDDTDFDTVGGLVLNGLGHMPKRGESYTLGRYRFKVVRADTRRVHLLQMTVLPKEKPRLGS